jgi:hypothetical protein
VPGLSPATRGRLSLTPGSLKTLDHFQLAPRQLLAQARSQGLQKFTTFRSQQFSIASSPIHATSGLFLDCNPNFQCEYCLSLLPPRSRSILKMGDVLVDYPVNSVSPNKKQQPADSIPNIDSLEGSGNDGGDEYSTLKRYQRHLEYGFLQRHL